ncbi:hypothetical protein D5086_023683 [Populus alba]|uniref:Uncharacterized protein n=1 Tax=Populus alba TaxID=43335 RepID=A0ACC4BB44_POPAL
MLHPSRFLKEIPDHLREIQAEVCLQDLQTKHREIRNETVDFVIDLPKEQKVSDLETESNDFLVNQINEASKESLETIDSYNGNIFLRRFAVEERSVVSHLFHQWAKKQAFQNPKRLLNKVGFVIDERLRVEKNKHKDVLRALKSCLSCDEAFQYAEYVLRWEQIPADQRAHLMHEKQEHFQKLRIENSMSSSAPTSKQVTASSTRSEFGLQIQFYGSLCIIFVIFSRTDWISSKLGMHRDPYITSPCFPLDRAI